MSGYALRLTRPTSRVELVATLIMRLPWGFHHTSCMGSGFTEKLEQVVAKGLISSLSGWPLLSDEVAS